MSTGAAVESPALVLTVPQVAKLLQISENSVYNLVSQGLLPHTRYGKLIRVPRWALLQSIASTSGAPVPLNFDVAMSVDQSVDGQRPGLKEADDGER
ncbi:MAG TPA: helix-turn-helix domain-containing protein [Dehalococcoidia bacterium]|nr:helix-turn-helix domain-containing protein [Dehalococcoidia bacterium]